MSSGVYVCYANYGHEGCDIPEVIFKKEIHAKRWCKVNNNGEYVFLEIESKFTVEVDG